MHTNEETLAGLRLRRTALLERIASLQAGGVRVRRLESDGFEDVTHKTLVELHTELGRIGAAIQKLQSGLRKNRAEL